MIAWEHILSTDKFHMATKALLNYLWKFSEEEKLMLHRGQGTCDQENSQYCPKAIRSKHNL